MFCSLFVGKFGEWVKSRIKYSVYLDVSDACSLKFLLHTRYAHTYLCLRKINAPIMWFLGVARKNIYTGHQNLPSTQ
jgi:hypothetical protein